MSSSGNANRERLKEQARLARALEASQGHQESDSIIHFEPLFGRPRKVSPAPHDATALRVNDLLGPYDVIQPSIQKNQRELIGVKHRNSVVQPPDAPKQPNGAYPQKKPDSKNGETGKLADGKTDVRSKKDGHGKLEQKPGGATSQPGQNHERKERSKKSIERESGPHRTSEKDVKPSAEELAKYANKHSGDLKRKNSLKQINQQGGEGDNRHGHRRSTERDHRRRKSSERDGGVPRPSHGSVERENKREDRTSVSSNSSGRRSVSVDRQQGATRNKERIEQQQAAPKSLHREGNIFARIKNEPEDFSSNNSRSNSTRSNEADSSKALDGKEPDASKLTGERQRTESSSSVASNGNPFPSASLKIKKEVIETEKAVSHDKSMQPPNGITLKGTFLKDTSKLKEAQKNLPKLKISDEVNKLTGEHGEKLEDILQEMKNIHAPLTAIQTPRKEESLKFPFAKDAGQVTKTVYANRKPSIHAEHKKEKTTGGDQLLLNDLAVSSDSDSDNEHDHHQGFPKKQDTEHKTGKRPTARSRSRSTSSESSGNGSDSSSDSNSDSGSSSDEAPEEPDSRQQEVEVKEEPGKESENGAWGLQHYLNQIKETNSSLSPCAKVTATVAPPPQPVIKTEDGLDFDNWKDSWKHIGVQDEVPPLIQRIDEKKEQAWDPGHHSLFSTDDEEPHGHHQSDTEDIGRLGVAANSKNGESVSPSVHTEITKNGGIKLTIGRMNETNTKKQRTSSASDMTISKSPQISQIKSAKLQKQASQPCLMSKSISNLGGNDLKVPSKCLAKKVTANSTTKESKEVVRKSVPKSSGRTSKNQKYKSKPYLSSDSSDDEDDDVNLLTPVKVPVSQMSQRSHEPKPDTPPFARSRNESKESSKKSSKSRKERTTLPTCDEPRVDVKPERTYNVEPALGAVDVNEMINAISGDPVTLLSPLPNTVSYSSKRKFSFNACSRDGQNESSAEPKLKESCQSQYKNSHQPSPKRKLSTDDSYNSSAKRLMSYISYTSEGLPSIKVHLNLSLIQRIPNNRLTTSSYMWQEMQESQHGDDSVFLSQSTVDNSFPHQAVPQQHSYPCEDGELSASASPEEAHKSDSSSDSDHGLKPTNVFPGYIMPGQSMELVHHETTDTSHDDDQENDGTLMHNENAADADEGEIVNDGEPEESSPETAVPLGGKVPFQVRKEKLNARNDILAKVLTDRPTLPSQKIPKRKLEEVRQDDFKRQKQLHSRYPPHVSDRESVSHEDDREWDRKHHRSRERRNSGSSTSSRHSSRSERDLKRFTKFDRDHDKYRELDRDRDQRDYDRDYEVIDRSRPFERRVRDWDAPSAPQHDSQTSGAYNISSGMRSAMDHWGAITTKVERRAFANPADTSRLEEEKQEPADHYLHEAKKLKHQADSLSDRLTKSLTYVEAVLSFIQCGNAMENDRISETGKIFTMYNETLNLLRDICKFRTHGDNEVGDKERKLSVLSLRIQSLLCLKLFKLKKNEASKLRQAIEDYKKSGSSKSVAPPSPYQMPWNKSLGTPSPMSPSPSPASVSSIDPGNGSVDMMMPHMMNGHPNSSYSSNSAISSPASVSIPQRIHSVTQQYITTLNHLHQCHDLWDQADAQSSDHKAFFNELDYHCCILTLHSSILHLVKYVRLGLHRLKDT